MSREIRRVPLDFDWPLNKPWEGYINRRHKPCPAKAESLCLSGMTPAYHWLQAVARLIALIGDEAAAEPYAEEHRRRGRTFPHPYLEEWPTAPRRDLPADVRERFRALGGPPERIAAHYMQEPPQLMPFTPELVEFVTKFAGEPPRFLVGHDSYGIVEVMLRVAGLEGTDWGVCKVCGGDGIDPAAKASYKAWKATPPPEGPGWQLWETVSEGSPISPVLPDEEAFGRYLLDHGYSPKAVKEFIHLGWCMTARGTVTEGPDGPVVSFREDIESLVNE
jgi:hypothetical protein